MSGHSKWSTIKHKKAINDAARGKVFSKLARSISMAIKSGGGVDPDTNYKLRMAIDVAKAANMPKVNIERALSRGREGGELEEVTYEGFGPGKIAVIVDVATDNRNRTGQEMKVLFERGGGQLAGPGAVSYNFQSRGMILVKLDEDSETQMLNLIDMGVDDIEEVESGLEVYVEPDRLCETRERLEKGGVKIISAELVRRPNNFQNISDSKMAAKALSFLEAFEDHDDVQKVYANLKIEDNVMKDISSAST